MNAVDLNWGSARRSQLKHIVLTICLFVFPTHGFCADYALGDMIVSDPVARPTTAMAMTGAGYFTVVNGGSTPDTLLEIIADFPRVMMHDTSMNDGIATMVHIDEGIIVPGGDSVTFAPGGKHVMFMGLKGDPFEIGEEIPAKLIFEKSGEMEITFVVQDIDN